MVLAITVLLALSSTLAAQQPGVHADANPTAEGEIKALELRLAELSFAATATSTRNISRRECSADAGIHTAAEENYSAGSVAGRIHFESICHLRK
jgi:hypothetical protein